MARDPFDIRCLVPTLRKMREGWGTRCVGSGRENSSQATRLDQFRWEHNYWRPHKALGMDTPAQRWQKSERRYHPHPPRWEYPAGWWVRKVDSSGKLRLKDRHWKIGGALSGEWVRLEQVGERILVYYCRALVRELDLASQRSTAVERWLESSD